MHCNNPLTMSNEEAMSLSSDKADLLEAELGHLRYATKHKVAQYKKEVKSLEHENQGLIERVKSLENELADAILDGAKRAVEGRKGSSNSSGGKNEQLSNIAESSISAEAQALEQQARQQHRSVSCSGAITWSGRRSSPPHHATQLLPRQDSRRRLHGFNLPWGGGGGGNNNNSNNSLTSSTTEERLREVEESWSSKLAEVEQQKDFEVAQLGAMLRSREDAIANLEQSVEIQTETMDRVRSDMEMMQSTLDRKTELVEELRCEIETLTNKQKEKDDLISQQNDRLRENSVTISTMVKTVKSQSDMMKRIRADMEQMKYHTEENEIGEIAQKVFSSRGSASSSGGGGGGSQSSPGGITAEDLHTTMLSPELERLARAQAEQRKHKKAIASAAATATAAGNSDDNAAETIGGGCGGGGGEKKQSPPTCGATATAAHAAASSSAGRPERRRGGLKNGGESDSLTTTGGDVPPRRGSPFTSTIKPLTSADIAARFRDGKAAYRPPSVGSRMA